VHRQQEILMISPNHHHLALSPKFQQAIQNGGRIPTVVDQVSQKDQLVFGPRCNGLQQAFESVQATMHIPHGNQTTGSAHADLPRTTAGMGVEKGKPERTGD
jgi:hypothetical protein